MQVPWFKIWGTSKAWWIWRSSTSAKIQRLKPYTPSPPSSFVWDVTESVFSLVELMKLKLLLINILLRKSVTTMDLHWRFPIAVLVSSVLKIQLIQILFNKDNCCWRAELVNMPEVTLLANLANLESLVLDNDLQWDYGDFLQVSSGRWCREWTASLFKAIECVAKIHAR